MAKHEFIEPNMSADRRALLQRINAIITEYQQAGYRLTLRQLYYQLVARDIVPNTKRSYQNMGRLLNDGRMMGLVDWDAIEDRTRIPRKASEFEDLSSLSRAALAAFRLDRWEGQRNYVELWVEKDALAGVLLPIANEWHINLMVNRGYSSQSAMFEAAKRFARARQNLPRAPPELDEPRGALADSIRKRDGLPKPKPRREGVGLTIIYLGDHDPSGEDMVRDVGSRLATFGVPVNVEKIALTMNQVDEYDPPPNPAKMTDSRAEKYVAEHGDSSWEVDALKPDVLQRIIRERLRELVDRDAMETVIDRELQLKELYRKVLGCGSDDLNRELAALGERTIIDPGEESIEVEHPPYEPEEE